MTNGGMEADAHFYNEFVIGVFDVKCRKQLESFACFCNLKVGCAWLQKHVSSIIFVVLTLKQKKKRVAQSIWGNLINLFTCTKIYWPFASC